MVQGEGEELSGSHPDVVLLHGFTGSAMAWPLMIRRGLAAGLRGVRALDLPGHGERRHGAAPRSFEWDASVADLAEQLGPDPVDLVGYSFGGRMALALALGYPGKVRRLVLESASPGLATDQERLRRRASDEELAGLLESEGLSPFLHRWEHAPLFASQGSLPREVREAVRAQRSANEPAALAAALRGLGTGAQPSLWNALPSLAQPTLLVSGELDTKFVAIARSMSASIPDARMALVPVAGHRVHLEAPEAWLQVVSGFLSSE